MFVPSIKLCGAVLCLACLFFSGCSQQGNPSEPAASAEETVPVEEKAPAYITAADDFSNLALDNAETPVYDHYTLAQRRAKGLPTALPKIVPYRDKKVAYLTFDDGPDDKNTAAVLDILKQEGVKATFYVLGKNVKAYPETTTRIFDEGHALGNHSYDHDYKRLYASAESYLAEMEQADDAIYELLGLRPLITRAPSGRMGNFTSAYENIITANGYVEHDWNVSSADAAPNHPVAQDFIDNISGQAVMDSAIILMHSSAGHEETVKALPEIIRVLREKGYTFGVITPMTPQPW
ncbi:polysaccharide deacetylase family protein [Selenomonas ruminantium]|uniref:polysaccharide deacetylase family protein n=1 Tax=Selenomonas ruminantium TaxID=971 RepID=UPI0026F1D601|nr:polysaccharide deacetylase family protein [Selenomonas ruminantium]